MLLCVAKMIRVLSVMKCMGEKFDTQDIKIRRHGHDRNASVNKCAREENELTHGMFLFQLRKR